MISNINQLIQNSNEALSGDPWIGESLMTKLKGIDFSLVNSTLPYSQKSIAKIVKHILEWRIFIYEKLKGNELFDIPLNSEKDWSDITLKNESDWNQLMVELVATQTKIIDLLLQNNDHFLKTQTPGKTYRIQYMMNGLIEHDTYHSGQIGILHSLLKSYKTNMA